MITPNDRKPDSVVMDADEITLDKETLKDLEPRGDARDAQGGRAPIILSAGCTVSCQVNCPDY